MCLKTRKGKRNEECKDIQCSVQLTCLIVSVGGNRREPWVSNWQSMFLFTDTRIIPVNYSQIAMTVISSSTLTDHYEHISRALVRITHVSHID